MYPKLRALIIKTYSTADARTVLRALETDLPEHVRERERVQCAIVKIGGGSLEKLLRAARGAHMDYRDTLMAADFGLDAQEHLRWLNEA
jgi:hypothetical protein